jgi:chromosome segregation ATPase
MNWVLRSAIVFVLPLQYLAAEPEGREQSPDLAKSIAALAGAVDRLAGELAKDVAVRAADKEARRVEIAVSVMGLRYRKIDRLEGEIQSATREEEESARQLEFMKAQADQLRKQGRTENAELGEGARAEMAIVELRIKSEEDRIAHLRERAGALQNEVAAERRRVASLEALLDRWMEEP